MSGSDGARPGAARGGGRGGGSDGHGGSESGGRARQLDAERLELGGGLEVLLQAALAGMAPGEQVEVVTRSRAVALELPGWARLEGHAAAEPRRVERRGAGGATAAATGGREPSAAAPPERDRGRWAVRLRRGPGSRVAVATDPHATRPGAAPHAHAGDRRAAAPGTATPGTATPGTATPGTAAPGTAAPGAAAPGGPPPPPLRDGGRFHTADVRGGGAAPPVPDAAARAAGLAPLGALPEPGAPAFDWPLHRRDQLWADDVAELAEQATAEQWDATADVPWAEAGRLAEPLDRAVGQVMTFIAQNEYAALYVPAAFLPQVHPAYPEALQWLAGHVHDEARHVEVFTKRALLCREPGHALAATELSLRTLLDEHDFTNAALLLNVLGEGTFLDLLRFVERHAPDPATAAAARLAHRDERRHVHFGISHVRHALAGDPERRAALVSAAEQRAAKLTELTGLSPLLTEGLTIIAAGSLRPAALSDGAAAVRGLLATMEENRIRRLRAAGFDAATATRLSELHTPNLM
ncbi:hypothetical protein [Conexibacter arvalis]|uniref:Ferritin-like domain-containing protein n=1 Tax=Conexibacter arvalis TaxID=912552 RepID=A0A840IEN0_9ACTN|nr:hypothetical protein [Conexibacter arvalis]MBB4662390.1 hypothetical protein [Conexibacter arvalis]